MASLVVSIHDVSPFTREACQQILDTLGTLGITQTSLLVIPDHHGRGRFLNDASFCEWLRSLADSGHEIVIHGYRHQRQPRGGEGVRDRLITKSYTAGEGEFYDLTYNDARELLEMALDDFAQVGLSPTGFIAPAWLISAPAVDAVYDLGFDYTTRLATVENFQSMETFHSQSLCWSVRAPWRRFVSLAWNRILFAQLKNNTLLRIAIHPVDIAHPAVWRQIRKLTATAAETRQQRTYVQWVLEG